MEPAPPKKRTTSLPPRRGLVKAQIFESLAGNLSSAAAKALTKIKRTPPSSATTSTSSSPPLSAYTSDGYSDQA